MALGTDDYDIIGGYSGSFRDDGYSVCSWVCFVEVDVCWRKKGVLELYAIVRFVYLIGVQFAF